MYHKEVTLAQLRLLSLIEHNPKVNIKDLAQMLSVTSSAVTQMTDEMVNDGFLIRSEKEDDRRSVELTITSKAKKSIREFEKIQSKNLEKIFEDLSNKEIKQLSEILNKIIKL